MFDEDEKRTLFSYIKIAIFYIRTHLHYHLFFKKKFTAIGSPPRAWGIWNVAVSGPNISIGKNIIFVSSVKSSTCLTTVKTRGHEGKITIGDDVLVMNGVRISSAVDIVIGDGCMLANFCYLTDSDWHGIHNRTEYPGKCAPIILERGAWIGDSAIVLKGVRIGENSIVGAGAVVTRDVPPNVIVAGNPARIVRELDPEEVVVRGDPGIKV